MSAGLDDGLDTDEALIARMAGGDSTALGPLYDRHGRAAFGLAYHMLGDPALAEDVVQDVFIAVWQRAGTFDARRGSVRAWLFTAVRNRCIDALRGPPKPLDLELVLPTGLIDREADDPSETAFALLEAQDVRRAVESLPADQRATIDLAFYRGLTHAQIAEQMRVPLGTVKGRLRLALDKLRDSMRSAGGYGRESLA